MHNVQTGFVLSEWKLKTVLFHSQEYLSMCNNYLVFIFLSDYKSNTCLLQKVR